MVLIRPKITQDPVAHIKRVELLRTLSLRELESLDRYMEQFSIPQPNVDGPGEIAPWHYVTWERWVDAQV